MMNNQSGSAIWNSLQAASHNVGNSGVKEYYSGQAGLYNIQEISVDRRPLIDRLATARHNEEINQAEHEKKVQESADRLTKIDEALQLCEDHPNIVKLFDVLKSIGLA
jgi:hypothetical protein